jgi:hypothetical protein
MENCTRHFIKRMSLKFGNCVSSWSNPSKAPPAPQRYPNVSYGFINVYTSHPTHIPLDLHIS